MYKIVDSFYGGSVRSKSAFFGVLDETRDTRRFETIEEATAALESDEARDQETTRSRRRVPQPAEDAWGRRLMNLRVVPSAYCWCIGDDSSWNWQVPIAVEFSAPIKHASGRRFRVTLNQIKIGYVEVGNSEGHPPWRASQAASTLCGDFASAYEAATYLLRQKNPPQVGTTGDTTRAGDGGSPSTYCTSSSATSPTTASR